MEISEYIKKLEDKKRELGECNVYLEYWDDEENSLVLESHIVVSEGVCEEEKIIIIR